MREFDLLIIGAGSGNSVLGPEHDDWNVAIAEHGLFGGTCLNVGCIPSKMFVYAAEVAEIAADGGRYGVHTRMEGADWAAIRDRVFGRIDPIAQSGLEWRHGLDNVTVFENTARFVGPKQVDVGGETVTAQQIVIAAGARAAVPNIEGLEDCGYHTSDTIMRLDELPERLLVLGGGYIAAELGGVMGALGSDVTFVLRGDTFLRREDEDIRSRFTEAMSEKYKVVTDASVRSARREGEEPKKSEIVLDVDGPGDVSELRGDALLVATGRIPNSAGLNPSAGGVHTNDAGYVLVDEYCQTTAPGVWALGDIANPVQLKHVANHEARVVRHNLTHPADLKAVDHRFIPHAVFGHPQVASVGLTERECTEGGYSYVPKVHPYAACAYGWALEDTTSVVKVIADANTRRLLGAHIIGPQASTLIQQLIQGMAFDLTVDQMAAQQYYIHPALPEVVEQALLEL